jgi:cellulose synthase/poly-beta-1,6-N-acetylglucosamine synthase-like glycosyltransferase
MDIVYGIFCVFEGLIFLMSAASVLYLFVFALAGSKSRSDKYPKSIHKNRFLVLIPAYNEGEVIFETAGRFLMQEYPAELFDLVVISDHISDEVNEELAFLPIILLKPTFEESSKAKSLNYAMDEVGCKKEYDIVVVLDADNNVDAHFLSSINDTYEAGSEVIQAHRRSKNIDTETAILDAISEEINNTIFRMGHANLGFSSALIGSGIAFDYKWFKENVKKIKTAGEDKEFEYELLKQNIYIEYLEDLYVYDEKVQKDEVYTKQRRRWLSAQYRSLKACYKQLLPAILSGNFDLADKIIQWALIPRTMLIGIIGLCSIVIPIISIDLAWKWWFLGILIVLTFAIAVPNYLIDDRLSAMIFHIPTLIFKQVLNILTGGRTGGKFLHTDHSVSAWDAKIALGKKEMSEEEYRAALATQESSKKSYTFHIVAWILVGCLVALYGAFVVYRNSLTYNEPILEKTVHSAVIEGSTDIDKEIKPAAVKKEEVKEEMKVNEVQEINIEDIEDEEPLKVNNLYNSIPGIE